MHIPEELTRVNTFVFDVDGTLAAGDHTVRPVTLDALKALDGAGAKLVIASGRAPISCAHTFSEAGLHGWTSACNGAVVSAIATGEVLRTRTVPADMFSATLDLVEEEDMVCSVMTATELLVNRHSWLTDFLIAANPGCEVVEADLRSLDPDTVLKLMPAAEKDVMAAAFPRFLEICPDATLSLDETCEVVGPGAEKADGVRFLMEHLGLDPQLVAGAGDGGNDVEWLRLVGWPMAMANARPEVREVARFHLGHHDEDAVARFVDAWLEARG